MLFLIQGFITVELVKLYWHTKLLQVFQFLFLPAVMTDSVCPVPEALDCSNQDPWMVVRVEADAMDGVNFLSKH